MKTLTLYVGLIALLGFATSGLAEIVRWQPCPVPEGTDTPNACTVHQVDVHPCREAAKEKPCRIRKGHSAGISFDFTPNFSGGYLKTRAYWVSEIADLPFVGMSNNACDWTPCPAVSGTRQRYNYTLSISDSYTTRIYNVKWKLWNAEEEECCFIFQIRLTN